MIAEMQALWANHPLIRPLWTAAVAALAAAPPITFDL